jgi:hypothetical protein
MSLSLWRGAAFGPACACPAASDVRGERWTSGGFKSQDAAADVLDMARSSRGRSDCRRRQSGDW